MGEVADLFATLGLRVNASDWAKGDEQIRKTQRAMEGLNRVARDLGVSRGAIVTAARVAAAQERGAAREQKLREAGARAQEREEQRAAMRRSAAGRRSFLERQSQQRQEAQEFAKNIAARDRMIGLGLTGLAGLGAFLGQKVVREGVKLNATFEDSKNKVAGLMALAKHTDFNVELANAGMLMEKLERAAAKLPGETSDYVEMLGMIAQPVSQAKLGLAELEKLTISATSSALTMKIPVDQAARDIEGALNGVYNSRDRFTGPLLSARGYNGEEGRMRFNALDAKKRSSEVMAAFSAPQLDAMQAAMGKSLSGRVATLGDVWHKFERILAGPVFKMLGEQLERVNLWFEKNEATIKAVAEAIGGALAGAFGWIIRQAEKVYDVFQRNRVVLEKIGRAVGRELVTALGLAAAAFEVILSEIDRFLRFLDHGLGKFLLDLLLLPGLLTIIGEKIGGIGKALEALTKVSAVNGLMWFIDKVSGHEEPSAPTSGALAPGATSALPGAPAISLPVPIAPVAPGGGASRSVSVGSVDVRVSSPSADPQAVAAEVGKVFDEKLANVLRSTVDSA